MKIASYNCKNCKTSAATISELAKKYDIILLQEHWLFEFQIDLLNEIDLNLCSTGKGVDKYNPIQPSQIPRGYGGVGILWNKEIDYMVKSLPDGNERFQCIELSPVNTKPLLISSVYLPTRGYKDSIQTFRESIDQMYEIVQKFQSTHTLIFGGDFNEDLRKQLKNDERSECLMEFMNECYLDYLSTGHTYVNPRGEDCSEIDYFVFSKHCYSMFSTKTILRDLDTNVSDHYPIAIEVSITLLKTKVTEKPIEELRKINWDKVDHDLYRAMVSDGVKSLLNMNLLNNINSEQMSVLTCNVLSEAAKKSAPRRKPFSSKPKLKVWNSEISKHIKELRTIHRKFKMENNSDNVNQLIQKKKIVKKNLRSKIRCEIAIRRNKHKQEILDAKTYDTKLFYKLIRQQRKTGNDYITDLHVGQEHFQGEHILTGFKKHFEALATPSDDPEFDKSFDNIVQLEFEYIKDIVINHKVPSVTREELVKAIQSINKGKSADIYGIVIEHILYAGEKLVELLVILVNKIFDKAEIPDVLKVGLLTPIFKNKGVKTDSQFYRGITVLPVLCKIIEAILKTRIQTKIENTQCTLQRGFTSGTSPLNASLILEECYREAKDLKRTMTLVLLDAKAAFDVVDHKNLMRRLFHIGVNDEHWNLINSLHTNATTSIKWKNTVSDSFIIHQGIRQGGVMSADLYKIYVDPLLHNLQCSNLGMFIGDIPCPATACADDVTLNSSKSCDTQTLIDIAYDYSLKQKYKLQPDKSVVIEIGNQKEYEQYLMAGSQMKNESRSTHLGIQRSTSINESIAKTVEENIKKARRTVYSLLSAGLHGETGLDPNTSLHLIKTYVLPVLLYGLEVTIPTKKYISQLEQYQKQLLKHVLSLPQTVADVAPYILSGFLPVEEQIHIKILTYFNNICHHSESSTEKKIARRQIAVKQMNSSSWFIEVKKLFLKYNLEEIEAFIDNPPKKTMWKNKVYKIVSNLFREKVINLGKMYKTLKYMNIIYTPGKIHPSIQTIGNSVNEISRLPVKIKLLTGTYILQSMRVKFNQNEIDPTCQLCGSAPEDMHHFLLQCETLVTIRSTILCEIKREYNMLTNSEFDVMNPEKQIGVLLDCSNINSVKTYKLQKLEYHCRRLVYSLHSSRYRMLSCVKTRKR